MARATAARRVGARARAPQAACRPAHVQLTSGRWARCSATSGRGLSTGGRRSRSPSSAIVKLCAKERHRLPDSRLVALLDGARARAAMWGTHRVARPRVRPAKIGGGREAGRRLATAGGGGGGGGARGRRASAHQAQPLLAQLLESSQPRAAAAAALLRLGWGVGLGQLSAAAHQMLEQMAGVALGNYRPAPRSGAHIRYAPPRRRRLGGAVAVDALHAEVEAAQAEWGAPDRRRGGAAGAPAASRRRHADAAAHRARRRRAGAAALAAAGAAACPERRRPRRRR